MSLLPSATEILFGVGAGEDVVGVTFECDYPQMARRGRIVSTSSLPAGLEPAEIDLAVRQRIAAGKDPYRLDRDALAELKPDLVITEDLCAVCAVDVSEVHAALDYLGCSASVLTTDPHSLAEVLASILQIGQATGRATEAAALTDTFRARLDDVAADVAGRAQPRTAVLEWTDPPFAPGHWVPEMVQIAGGRNAGHGRRAFGANHVGGGRAGRARHCRQCTVRFSPERQRPPRARAGTPASATSPRTGMGRRRQRLLRSAGPPPRRRHRSTGSDPERRHRAGPPARRPRPLRPTPRGARNTRRRGRQPSPSALLPAGLFCCFLGRRHGGGDHHAAPPVRCLWCRLGSRCRRPEWPLSTRVERSGNHDLPSPSAADSLR